MKTKEVVRGAKDFLPLEAAKKRNIENTTVELFQSWGYEEVITPTFEYLEVIEAGAGEGMRRNLFLVPDRDGRLLALRPEMTIPLARVASTKLKESSMPLRLFYNANLFVHTETQVGRYKEFYQLGVELIGASGAQSDAEVIALAAETMQKQGIDFKIGLNHIGIFNSLIRHQDLPEDDVEEIKRLTLKKDLVELENLVNRLELGAESRKALINLPVLHGGTEVFEHLAGVRHIPGVNQAMNDLAEVYGLLADYGIQDSVFIDLGVLRGFDYYTGIVFEGYSPRLGYPVLGGGRYDQLLEKFGMPCAATGFAIGIERLLLCLDDVSAKGRRCMVGGNDRAAVLETAKKLRLEGCLVTVDVSGETEGQPVYIREL